MEERNTQLKNNASRAPTTGMLKKFPKDSKKGKLLMALGAFLVVLVGVGAGWLLSGKKLGSSTSSSEEKMPDVKVSNTEAGVSDTSAFPDEAEGTLKEGGIDGEGTYHLERPGGESKYVYLTSTVIDLGSFVDKDVKVWGETVSGKKAGWLMDVGKIQVVE